MLTASARRGAFKNLREFLEALSQMNQLVKVSEAADPVLEITEISNRVMKSPGGGAALLFENVKGSRFPLLINALGSMERMTLALGVKDFSEIAARVRELLKPQIPSGLLEKLSMLPKLAELASFPPKRVSSGPCQDVIEKESASLFSLPAMKCWPEDGGRYITMGLTLTQDPETGIRNCGLYRLQIFDEKTIGMHWQAHKDGRGHYAKYKRLKKKMAVAIVIGCDPATIYSGSAPLPPHVDELLFSGFLRREPVEMVRCVTSELEVPAEAEFVLEGFVDPEEPLQKEGPFGDHTGFYSLAEDYPVFHLTAITRRKNPIYISTIVGRPPMEDFYLGKATEKIFLPILQMMLPEISDMNFPAEGIFNNFCVVSIKKQYPGHARKVAHALWGLGQMMFTKVLLVVEENVNVHNLSEAAWTAFNHIDPQRDVFFVEGPVDTLNYASPILNFGSKMGIDATRKWKEEGFARDWPGEIVMTPEVKAQVSKRFGDLFK